MISCDCKSDGFCPRYNREMGGRMRAICAGGNVDLGTAAAFREQWVRESGRWDEPTGSTLPTPLLLKTDQAPGDTVAMTAAVYSLHRAHPGKYITFVESPHPEVWEWNPDVAHDPSEMWPGQSPHELRMHYPAIHQSNDRAIHFMQGWCEHLGASLGIQVPLLTNRPRLYFSTTQEECGNYWVVCSGGKRDFTCKQWHGYQEVVDRVRGRVGFIQVGDKRGDHPPLSGTAYVAGETPLRELFDLVRRSRGVLCGVSLLMHVAAALEKPCIVVAGGREPVAWNAYPRQHYLHTVGELPCTTSQGVGGGACWRSRVVPLGDGTVLDQHTCLYPVEGIPECMRRISLNSVVELILRYNC